MRLTERNHTRIFGFWGLFVLLSACSPTTNQVIGEGHERTLLSRDFLLGTANMASPVATDAFQSGDTPAPANHFEGRLSLRSGQSPGQAEVVVDLFDLSSQTDLRIADLPPFSFEFIRNGGMLIPTRRGRQSSDHPYWEFILEAGQVWNEPGDAGWSRASLPFALGQRNANCTHNGLLTFLFKSDGSISRVAYQVGSETCHYLQVNLWGAVPAQFEPGQVENGLTIIQAHQEETAARLPIRPINALADVYPDVDLSQFALHDLAELSTYGFVIDGMHYSGGCPTRFGPYPYCDTIDLPSYSLAKTIVAGSIFMQLEQLYPGSRDLLVTDYVPECRLDNRWVGVTLGQLLDMSSGNYQSTIDQVDEFFSYEGAFFSEDTHSARITDACNLFPRRSPPGTAWVYHTTDTYIAGTLMNAFLREQVGVDQDIFSDLLVAEILQPQYFSQTMQQTLRSYDGVAQPLTGFGLTLHPDDVARFASFLMTSDGLVNGRQVLNRALLNAALQRDPADQGMTAEAGRLRYNNGLWAGNVLPREVCSSPSWIPFMSGYGGISVALLPNDTVYYVFSDGAHFKWAEAAIESHQLKPYCESDSHDIR